eukprot:362011-Prymnesium_polylepis.1
MNWLLVVRTGVALIAAPLAAASAWRIVDAWPGPMSAASAVLGVAMTPVDLPSDEPARSCCLA